MGRFRRRLGQQRGAAVVEFSISIVLLLTMLFGIITFGLILSFKQGLTQAAAEGARAGAVSTAAGAPAAAATAAAKSVNAYGKTCGSGGLTCTYTVNPCGVNPTPKCITVKLEYNYATHPLLPPIPLLSGVMPDKLTSESVAQVNS
ncbi:MAG: TadE/TadG family type IV pilus assembly protein [Acidimicrobiales bacterium]